MRKPAARSVCSSATSTVRCTSSTRTARSCRSISTSTAPRARKASFHRLTIQQGYGNGLNGFYLDPDYTHNGKFYTVHIEDPAMPRLQSAKQLGVPALNVSGYTTTTAIKTPGPLQNEGVLVEWTDSNPSNSTFEGTARELLRVQLNTRSHPMGDLIFNPTARRGDPDWRVLVHGMRRRRVRRIEDHVAIRANPQRLDNLEGKILRIIPDLNEHVATSTVSENGRYRIPNDNPFVSTPGARKEIWAYGFRNPASSELGGRSGEPRQQSPDRQLGRAAHVGDGVSRAQRRSTTATDSAKATSSSNRTTRPDRCPRTTRSRCRSASTRPTRCWSRPIR